MNREYHTSQEIIDALNKGCSPRIPVKFRDDWTYMNLDVTDLVRELKSMPKNAKIPCEITLAHIWMHGEDV